VVPSVVKYWGQVVVSGGKVWEQMMLSVGNKTGEKLYHLVEMFGNRLCRLL
jgi:hypothetical protein